MAQQVPLDRAGRVDNPERDAARDDATREICPDLAYRRLAIVNVFFGKLGAGDRQWVLVDGRRGYDGNDHQCGGESVRA